MDDNQQACDRFEREMKALHDQHLKRMKQIDRSSKLMYALIIVIGALAIAAPLIHHWVRGWL